MALPADKQRLLEQTEQAVGEALPFADMRQEQAVGLPQAPVETSGLATRAGGNAGTVWNPLQRAAAMLAGAGFNPERDIMRVGEAVVGPIGNGVRPEPLPQSESLQAAAAEGWKTQRKESKERTSGIGIVEALPSIEDLTSLHGAAEALHRFNQALGRKGQKPWQKQLAKAAGNVGSDVLDAISAIPAMTAEVMLPRAREEGETPEQAQERLQAESFELGQNLTRGLVGGTAYMATHPLESFVSRPATSLLMGREAAKFAQGAVPLAREAKATLTGQMPKAPPPPKGPVAPPPATAEVPKPGIIERLVNSKELEPHPEADVLERAAVNLAEALRKTGKVTAQGIQNYLRLFANGFYSGDPRVEAMAEEFARSEEKAFASVKSMTQQMSGQAVRSHGRLKSPPPAFKPGDLPGVPSFEELGGPLLEGPQAQPALGQEAAPGAPALPPGEPAPAAPPPAPPPDTSGIPPGVFNPPPVEPLGASAGIEDRVLHRLRTELDGVPGSDAAINAFIENLRAGKPDTVRLAKALADDPESIRPLLDQLKEHLHATAPGAGEGAGVRTVNPSGGFYEPPPPATPVPGAEGVQPPVERTIKERAYGAQKVEEQVPRNEPRDVAAERRIASLGPDAQESVRKTVGEIMKRADLPEAQRGVVTQDVLNAWQDSMGGEGGTANWKGQMRANPDKFARDYLAAVKREMGGQNLTNKVKAFLLDSIDRRDAQGRELTSIEQMNDGTYRLVRARTVPSTPNRAGKYIELDPAKLVKPRVLTADELRNAIENQMDEVMKRHLHSTGVDTMLKREAERATRADTGRIFNTVRDTVNRMTQMTQPTDLVAGVTDINEARSIVSRIVHNILLNVKNGDTIPTVFPRGVRPAKIAEVLRHLGDEMEAKAAAKQAPAAPAEGAMVPASGTGIGPAREPMAEPGDVRARMVRPPALEAEQPGLPAPQGVRALEAPEAAAPEATAETAAPEAPVEGAPPSALAPVGGGGLAAGDKSALGEVRGEAAGGGGALPAPEAPAAQPPEAGALARQGRTRVGPEGAPETVPSEQPIDVEHLDLSKDQLRRLRDLGWEIQGYRELHESLGMGDKGSPSYAHPLMGEALKWHQLSEDVLSGQKGAMGASIDKGRNALAALVGRLNALAKSNITNKSISAGINNLVPNLSNVALQIGTNPVSFMAHAEKVLDDLKKYHTGAAWEIDPVDARAYEALGKAGIRQNFVSHELSSRGLRPSQRLRLGAPASMLLDPKAALPTTKFAEWLYEHGDQALRVPLGVDVFKYVTKALDKLGDGEYVDLWPTKRRYVRVTRKGGKFFAEDPYQVEAAKRVPRELTPQQVDDLVGQHSAVKAAQIVQDYPDQPQAVKALNVMSLDAAVPFKSYAGAAIDLPGKGGLATNVFMRNPFDLHTNSPAVVGQRAAVAARTAVGKAAVAQGLRSAIIKQGANGPVADAFRNSSSDDKSVIIGSATQPGSIEGVKLGQWANLGPTLDVIGAAVALAKKPEQAREHELGMAGRLSALGKEVVKADTGQDFATKDAIRLAMLSGGPFYNMMTNLIVRGNQGKSFDPDVLFDNMATALAGGTNAAMANAAMAYLGDPGAEGHPRIPVGGTRYAMADLSGRQANVDEAATVRQATPVLQYMLAKIIGKGWQARDFNANNPEQVKSFLHKVGNALKESAGVPGEPTLEKELEKREEQARPSELAKVQQMNEVQRRAAEAYRDLVDRTIEKAFDEYEQVYNVLNARQTKRLEQWKKGTKPVLQRTPPGRKIDATSGASPEDSTGSMNLHAAERAAEVLKERGGK